MGKIKIESNGTYYVEQGDTASIEVSGGANVTLKGHPGDPVKKFTVDFKNADSRADVVTIDLSTFDHDGLKIELKNYDPSDQIILEGVTITGVDPGDDSELTFTYVGSDGNVYTGYIKLKDGGAKDFTADPSPIIICFAKGSLILTDQGEVPVENLRVGDRVITRDHGPQPIRWIGSRQLDSIDLAVNPQLFPIKISQDAFGFDGPTCDLWVSPQHRFCVGGAETQLMFGHDDMLVAAKYLVNGRSVIEDRSVTTVCYYHILFDHHQIVFSNGTPSESLHTGDMAMSALDKSALAEVLTLFPSLADRRADRNLAALPVLKAYEARAMLAQLELSA